MRKTGPHIPLRIESFLNPMDRKAFAEGSMTRLAEGGSVRIGRQDLYEDASDAIEHYSASGFDIVEEMKKKPGNFLWVRARAIDADTVNENGDYFPWSELLKERVVKGAKGEEKVPAYKTFEGCLIFTNHDNEDCEKAKGRVVHAELDPDEKCVYCTFYVDADAYPQLARSIRMGTITDVSMGASVEESECSICGNVATTESQWCNCLKNFKGKRFSGKIETGSRKGQTVNEIAYEINKDVKFIELSVVSTGAYASCKFDSIIAPDEVLAYASKLQRTAEKIGTEVAAGIEEISGDVTPGRIEVMAALKQSQALLARLSSLPDATMIRSSAMNREAYANVLDTLNNVLNQIEAVIVNLLSRKDNIDLSHVAKLSKAMADIQQEVSDMIDDGIGSMSDGVGLAAPQPGQPQAPQPGQQPQQAPDSQYSPQGDVGMGMFPPGMQAQPQANLSDRPNQFNPLEHTIPSGIGASAEQGLVRMASGLQGAGRRVAGILAEMGTPRPAQPEIERGGAKPMSSNTIYELMGHNLMRKRAASISADFKAEDGKHKVIISTTGDISGQIDGMPTDWNPSSGILSDEDIEAVNEGRVHVAADKLLREFVKAAQSGQVRTAGKTPVTPSDIEEHQLEPKREGTEDDVREHTLEGKRTGTEDDVTEHKLEAKRTGTEDDVREHTLEKSDAKILGRRPENTPKDVQEHQLEELRVGTEDDVTEHKIEKKRAGTASPDRVVSAAVNAVGRAIADAGAAPLEAMEVLASVKDDPEAIEALTGSHKVRVANRQKVEFGLAQASHLSIADAMKERLADVLAEDSDILVNDLTEVLAAMAASPERTQKTLGAIAKKHIENVRFASSSKDLPRRSLIQGALSAMLNEGDDSPARGHVKMAILAAAETLEETGASPVELFDELAALPVAEGTSRLEAERLPDATASRSKLRERKAYWGKVASAEELDLTGSFLGHLADMSSDPSLSSSALWTATAKLAAAPEAAKTLVTAALKGRERNAAVKLNDTTSTCRELTMDVSDIGGASPRDENFEDSARDFAISFLRNAGYRVDPDTFSFTRFSVDENTGLITAAVESSVHKTLSGEGEAPVPAPSADFQDSFEGIDQPVLMTPNATAKRKQLRTAARGVREAQGLGGGAEGGAMGGPAGGAPPPQGPPNAAEMPGPGLASLFGGEGGPGEGGDENLDNTSNPGKTQPIGTVCPACGSMNVELASSRGECGDCGTKYDVTLSIENIVTPGNDLKGESGPEKEPGAEEGLGAALAPGGPEGAMGAPPPGGPPAGPGGGTGGAPPMAGGLPPMGASLRWYGDPEAFVKLAAAKAKGWTEEQIEGPKPPGSVCIMCGNRRVLRASSQVFCDACGTVGHIDVRRSKAHPSRLVNSVTVLLPPAE